MFYLDRDSFLWSIIDRCFSNDPQLLSIYNPKLKRAIARPTIDEYNFTKINAQQLWEIVAIIINLIDHTSVTWFTIESLSVEF